jgi:hypothetical protein
VNTRWLKDMPQEPVLVWVTMDFKFIVEPQRVRDRIPFLLTLMPLPHAGRVDGTAENLDAFLPVLVVVTYLHEMGIHPALKRPEAR